MFEKFDIFYDEQNRCYQVRTRTESCIIEFDDLDKSEVFRKLVSLTSKGNVSINKVFSNLIKDHDKAKILNVLSTLNDFGLLTSEISAEVRELINNNSQNKNEVTDKAKQISKNPYSDEIVNIEDVKLLIIGDGDLSISILTDFNNRQFKECRLVSANTLSNYSIEDTIELISNFSFIILDATSWSPTVMELLNKAAIRLKKPWIHVGGIEDYHLKIGPLFYGSETGCYSCLIKRIKSNHSYAKYLNSYQAYLSQNKISAKPDSFIYSDVYHNIIKSYLYLEISKFFELWAVPVTWRGYISINTVNFSLEKHDLLKVPFCEECKPQLEYNPAPWLEPISLKP